MEIAHNQHKAKFLYVFYLTISNQTTQAI